MQEIMISPVDLAQCPYVKRCDQACTYTDRWLECPTYRHEDTRERKMWNSWENEPVPFERGLR